jgi:hypothetical protein
MQFVNSRNNGVAATNSPSYIPINPVMPFSRKFLNYKTNKQITEKSEISPTISDAGVNNIGKGKMKWGEPTWFLFHTMAHKIKDESFTRLRVEILQHITILCNNLPCPTCAAHATQYLNGINYNTITTKQQLKDLLYTFHNSVNQRKGLSLFPFDKLDEKYSAASTVNIIQHFIYFFQDKSFNINMIANDLYRKRIVKSLADWFNLNLSEFDM